MPVNATITPSTVREITLTMTENEAEELRVILASRVSFKEHPLAREIFHALLPSSYKEGKPWRFGY